MSTIQSIIDAGPPIDQQILSGLSKGSLRKHLHGQTGASIPREIEALWHCLVSSTLNPDSSEKYLTTACNCISVFLLSAASSPVSGVKQFVTSGKVWFEGFDCVQQAFDGGKTKPALQVLETLAQLLREHPDNAAASVILQQSSRRLLKILFTGTPSGQIKSACIALTCLVKRTGLLTVLEDEVADCLDQVSSLWKRYQLQNGTTLGDLRYQRSGSSPLFLALLFAAQNLETRSAALKLFSFLLQSEDWTRGCTPAQSAAEIIELFLRNDTASLGDFADNIIPVILDNETRYKMFRDLYKPDKAKRESRLILYLSILKAGRLKKFLSESDLAAEVDEGLGHSATQSQDPEDCYASFRLLLRAASPSVRVHAYDLLTANFGTIAAIPGEVLQCLLSSFKYLHDDNDAHERGEVISITRRLLGRLESSRVHLRKKRPRSTQVEDTLARYDDFLRQLGKFLLLETHPGISYQRHILALHTLQLLLHVAPDPSLDSQSLAYSLSNLILDPFDDVRSLAATLLKGLIELSLVGVIPPFVVELLRNVEEASANTCRHDHADAAGQLRAMVISHEGFDEEAQVALCDRLHDRTTKMNDLTPGSDFALHATLLGLAYAFGAGVKTMEDMRVTSVEICRKIWTMVQPQLCVDSPETATDESGEDGGPKDLLSYSWRALRDSSLLLQSILQVCSHDYHTLAQVGWLCIEQLTLLRHRGAFSTVAQTFTLCCDRARSSHDSSTRQLNDAWYKAALYEIDNQSTKLTRRSAGLPAMICAVVSPIDHTTFSDVYQHLKGIASESVTVGEKHHGDIPLPQVHALNCIKDIMTQAKFRAPSERYIGEALELAANCMTSSIWAIRNCGLMLLRACMTRLTPHGPDSPPDMMEVNDGNGTRLSPLLVTMTLLQPDIGEPSNSTIRSEIIFAGLDLAKYVGVAHPDNRRLTQSIYQHLNSSVWAIRDHAARALAVLVVVNSSPMRFLDYFSPPPNCSENLLHGVTLFQGYILESCRKNGDEQSLLALFLDIVQYIAAMTTRMEAACSPYTTAAFLDINNDLIMHELRAEQTRFCSKSMSSSLRAAIAQIETSNPFCGSRILLSQVLCLLTERQYQVDQDKRGYGLLINALVQRPDAARFVMEQIEGLPCLSGLADMLIELITQTQAADVRALAMMRLAECMQSDGGSFSEAHTTLLYSAIGDFGSCDRTLWEASLRLEACLIHDQLSQLSGSITSRPLCRLRSWLFKIKVASKDQLEHATRWSAAAALRHCETAIILRLDEGPLMMTSESQELMLDFAMAVYDQLNDDDEEIRHIAEQTAADFLQQSRPASGLPIPMCALAAREALLGLIAERFGAGPELPRLALIRIVSASEGDVPELRPSTRLTLRESVSMKLTKIKASMNDLFAEEKQNLYIDDLDEVTKWSKVLRQCDLSQLNSESRLAAVEWCSEGLDALTTLLSSASGLQADSNADQISYHPLGPTYHSEILVLCLRVVELALALTTPDVKEDEDSSFKVDESEEVKQLRQKQKKLRDTASGAKLHRRLLEALAVAPSSGTD